MPEIRLNQALKDWGLSGSELARGVNVSPATISLIRNKDQWPGKPSPAALKKSIEEFIRNRMPEDDIYPTGGEIEGLWETVAAAAQSEDQPGVDPDQPEDIEMLPRKTSLSLQARQHWRLPRSPFGDVETDADMYLSGSVRYSREFVLEKVRTGGFGAIIGESGAGKSTLVEEVEEYIAANQLGIGLIRPMICGMDVDSGKGSPLKARSILLTILDSIGHQGARPSDLPRLTEATRKALADRMGGEGQQRYCLVIDDAHRLSGPTLNHLKDFYELKLGRARLLGIMLMGQLKLGTRLDPRNPEVHQITQRCEVHYLPPLGADLEAYLARRFAAVGRPVSEVLAPDACDAIRVRLSAPVPTAAGRKAERADLTYPLAVNNLVALAMNFAADPGYKLPLITAEIIREA